MSVPIWINGLAYLPYAETEARIAKLEAALHRVDMALDQTSAVLWKSLKAEVKSVLASTSETFGKSE